MVTGTLTFITRRADEKLLSFQKLRDNTTTNFNDLDLLIVTSFSSKVYGQPEDNADLNYTVRNSSEQSHKELSTMCVIHSYHH